MMLSIGDKLHRRKAANALLGSQGKCISKHVARGPGNWVWKSDCLPNVILKDKRREAQKISLAFLMALRWELM